MFHAPQRATDGRPAERRLAIVVRERRPPAQTARCCSGRVRADMLATAARASSIEAHASVRPIGLRLIDSSRVAERHVTTLLRSLQQVGQNNKNTQDQTTGGPRHIMSSNVCQAASPALGTADQCPSHTLHRPARGSVCASTSTTRIAIPA